MLAARLQAEYSKIYMTLRSKRIYEAPAEDDS